MANCKHQFILIDQTRKTDRTKPLGVRMDANTILGAKAGCVLCGEVRIVWENGEITIQHAQTSDTKD